MKRQSRKASPSDRHAHRIEAEPGRGRLQVEAQQVLEVGEPVVAAEAHVVAEEREHQREGHRLGDDREIDAGDPGAEGEPAEHEGEQARHQDHHQHGEGKMIEAVPVPGQLLPGEEHHEVGQHRVAVDAAGADLAHQVHAHGVAAEREEGAVAEREDAGVAPDQVQRQRQQREADVFAEQRHEVVRQMQDRARRDHAVQRRDADQQDQADHAEGDPAGQRQQAGALHLRPPPSGP